MRLLEYVIDVGFGPDCQHTGEIEVEDSATAEEIEEQMQEIVWNYVSYWVNGEELV